MDERHTTEGFSNFSEDNVTVSTYHEEFLH